MSNKNTTNVISSSLLLLLLLPFSIIQEQAHSKTHSSSSAETPIPAAITDNPNPAPAAAKNLADCDSLLLQNIADKSPSRFKVMSPCVTVNGTITLVHTPSDGDTVFALALDKPFSTMVTKANFNPTMKGGIWVELICQRPNTSKEPVHKGDCNDPAHIINFPRPKVGDRVEVTGQYQQDIREGGHMEIHPVTVLTKIH
ncbi:MAG: hypothetical protein WBQ25_00540 [Nitrososphaeraceae archaeon]